MTINADMYAFIGGGPYVDKLEAERQIDLYYKNEKGVQVLRNDDTGMWHIVKNREQKK